MRYFLILLACLATAPTAHEQTPEQHRRPVSIEFSGDDATGRQVAYYLRETVAKSAIFREGSSHDDLTSKISLVSIDLNDDSPGSGTAISVMHQVLTTCGPALKPGCARTFITHEVVIVGRRRAEMEAQSILASYSEFLERIKLANPECRLLSEP